MSLSMRLHITPLTPELLPVILGPTLAKTLVNVQYQTINTQPENNYGFVDLPERDARKLMSKLHGAILKGRRMKIEEARPKKRRHESIEPDDPVTNPEQLHKKSKKEKKAKKDKDVIDGHELSPERTVKRGWTDPAAKSTSKSTSKKSEEKQKFKQQAPSKYTDKEELLFRTHLPPNKENLVINQKRKKDRKAGKDKSSKASPTLVHEFQRTTIQPSFLRDTTSSCHKPTNFVDGVGWVDGKGNLLEGEPSAVKRTKTKKPVGLSIDLSAAHGARKSAPIESASSVASAAPSSAALPEDDLNEAVSSSPGSASSVSDSTSAIAKTPLADDTSSSGTSSSESELDPAESLSKIDTPHPGPDHPSAGPSEVHPLEALFKKPSVVSGTDTAKPSLEIETAFSFFDRASPESENQDLPEMPMTPFTSQDVRSRGMRSAAPTPDTAHPSRFNSFANAFASRSASRGLDDEEDDSTLPDQINAATSRLPSERPQSEFEKRFWAERGQNNRAWKARSRAAKKEQRQTENRLRRPRHAA